MNCVVLNRINKQYGFELLTIAWGICWEKFGEAKLPYIEKICENIKSQIISKEAEKRVKEEKTEFQGDSFFQEWYKKRIGKTDFVNIDKGLQNI